MTEQRLIGVAERAGFISCSCQAIEIADLPPYGGKSLQKIRKMIRDSARRDNGRPLILQSYEELIGRMRKAGIDRLHTSIYYVGRSRYRHGWQHQTIMLY